MQTLSPQQSILGYVLRERIGSGGYGEVWSAEAPGGIAKAIKFIYGVHDESRAQVELKSLDKIKEVRHPFLLSLDRIDIVDNRVVVISELADESLAEIFDCCRAEGQDGIPRDQLLDYLRDAADGLDYISDHHSLQHLDVKPENLLIVSGHVKVADFGLVKNIHSVTQSLMNGLTPTYAPPELFDGQPCKYSDQYSLAIVYQEMLTGIRPFRGTTPAQLAAQHVHGYPDLEPLNRGDKMVLQKALAKKPGDRFSSCREMVDELMNRKSRKRSQTRPKILKQMDRSDGATMQIQPQAIDVTNHLSSSQLPDRKLPIEIRESLNLDDTTAKCRPTLVVGLGNTGTRVLGKFRRMINERLGDLENLPAIKLLAIDTDRNSLSKAMGAIDGTALAAHEVLEMPLRQSQEYRDKAGAFSNWLSRRWIYNVPRSLQTESLRPLGRLAFADHCENIFSRLHKTINDLVRPEAISETAETLQLDPAEAPRVILVSSIAGGVGSGSVLDFAYAMRTIFSDLGIRDYSVEGILTHSTSRLAGDPQLNVANSFAFLSELGHFVQYGYPGDESLGIPEFEDSIPFDHTYVLDLGSNIQKNQFDRATQKIAEYTFLDVATPARNFFEKSRQTSADDETFALRTFGYQSIGIESLKPFVDELMQSMIQLWTDPNRPNEQADQVAQTMIEQFLGYDQVLGKWSEVVLNHISPDRNDLNHRMTELARSCRKSKRGMTEFAETINQMLDSRQAMDFVEWLEPQLKQAYQEESVIVEENCTPLMDLQELRIGGVLRAFQQMMQAVQSAFETIELVDKSVQDRRREQLAEVRQLVESRAGDDQLQPVVCQYLELVAKQVANRALQPHYRRWASLLSKVETEIQTDRRNVMLWGSVGTNEEQVVDEPCGATEEYSQRFSSRLEDLIESQFPSMVQKLATTAQSLLFKPQGGFAKAIRKDSDGKQNLAKQLEEMARQMIAGTLQEVDVNRPFQVIADDDNERYQCTGLFVENAQPEINSCGGEAQVLFGLPARFEGEFAGLKGFADHIGQSPNVIPATHGQIALCVETEGIALSAYAFKLLSNHPECVELVERIHTRSDINWTDLAKIISS